MAAAGSGSYSEIDDLPALVAAAVQVANESGFARSCRPEQGRLLHLLAAGRSGGVIGETGTGCGVGLAWMASAVDDQTRLVSVERDDGRAAAAARVFAAAPNVEVLHADWTALLEHGPFDLLVLDGGGAGKAHEGIVDIATVLTIGGMVVIDDFTPMREWPPQFLGGPDVARLRWFDHPALATTEIRLAPDLAAIVGTRVR